MQVTTYGVDLAKRVFQVHWVEPDSGEVKRKMLAREEFAAHARAALRIEHLIVKWGRVVVGELHPTSGV